MQVFSSNLSKEKSRGPKVDKGICNPQVIDYIGHCVRFQNKTDIFDGGP